MPHFEVWWSCHYEDADCYKRLKHGTFFVTAADIETIRNAAREVTTNLPVFKTIDFVQPVLRSQLTTISVTEMIRILSRPTVPLSRVS